MDVHTGVNCVESIQLDCFARSPQLYMTIRSEFSEIASPSAYSDEHSDGFTADGEIE